MSHFKSINGSLLKHDFYPKVTAFYFKTWISFYMDFHRHDDIEIMYVLKGQCIVKVDKQSLLLKQGSFILLDANVPHKLVIDPNKPCRMLNIEFGFVEKNNLLPPLRKLINESQNLHEFLRFPFKYLVLKDTNEIYHTLKSLVLELDSKEEEQELMVQLHMTQLFVWLARMMKNALPQNEESNVYVKRAIDFLHQNYDCDIKIKDVGEAVNLHPGYLHRIFKKQMNVTMVEYLTSLRIEKAKMLLSETDIPIIDISVYVGMNSRQYFSLLFKKYTGTTPLQYRKFSQRNVHQLKE
ncbi:putative DNA-binding protein [Bacillus sp. TS-2]|nr:putative DNA-binding protein [Bacillus sp. TS-2]